MKLVEIRDEQNNFQQNTLDIGCLKVICKDHLFPSKYRVFLWILMY